MTHLLFPVTEDEFYNVTGVTPEFVHQWNIGRYCTGYDAPPNCHPTTGATFQVPLRYREGVSLLQILYYEPSVLSAPLHFYSLGLTPINTIYRLASPRGDDCSIPTGLQSSNPLLYSVYADAFDHGVGSTKILDSYPLIYRPGWSNGWTLPPLTTEMAYTLESALRDLDLKPKQDQIRAFLHLLLAFCYRLPSDSLPPEKIETQHHLHKVIQRLIPVWRDILLGLEREYPQGDHPLAGGRGLAVLLDIQGFYSLQAQRM